MVEEIRAAGHGTPLAIVADINVDSERIINETVKHFDGRLDVLVNNAGVVDPPVPFHEGNIESFDRIWNTNLRSVIQLTKLAVPHLERTKGNIVNISSVAGLRPVTGVLAYCVSKAGLDQFTKCAALELAPKGIRVNSMNPGIVATPIFQTVGINQATAEAYFESASKNYPLGRVGVVSDTSKAIAFLASDNAEFITGTLLPVEGGRLLGTPEPQHQISEEHRSTN